MISTDPTMMARTTARMPLSTLPEANSRRAVRQRPGSGACSGWAGGCCSVSTALLTRGPLGSAGWRSEAGEARSFVGCSRDRPFRTLTGHHQSEYLAWGVPGHDADDAAPVENHDPVRERDDLV